jgi:hypothetical protein
VLINFLVFCIFSSLFHCICIYFDFLFFVFGLMFWVLTLVANRPCFVYLISFFFNLQLLNCL